MSIQLLRQLLTDRHIEIGHLIARGMSNKEIASALGITEITVRNHLAEIFTRLGVRNRTAFAVLVVRHDAGAGY